LNNVSAAGKDFIKKCLTSDYKERGFIKDMLEHPWIANIEEALISESV
jgi:serine/threonine protein kinase